MGARWPLAQGGRVGRAGESSAFCPPAQPCRKLVVFVFFGEVRGAHLLSGAEARRSSPVKSRKTARHEPEDTSARTQVYVYMCMYVYVCAYVYTCVCMCVVCLSVFVCAWKDGERTVSRARSGETLVEASRVVIRLRV